MPVIQTFDAIHSYVAPSNVGSITFSSLNQNYDHLVITGGFTRNIDGNFGGRSADFVFNGITSNYKAVNFGASNGGSLGTGRTTNGSSTINPTAGNINYQGGRQCFEVWIPNYKNVNFHKHGLMKSYGNDTSANNGGAMSIVDHLITTTSALTSLTISEISETFVTGDWVTIYGVKNA